jgi:Flp pilus assembly protein TadG
MSETHLTQPSTLASRHGASRPCPSSTRAKLLSDCSGASAVVFALLLSGLVGFAGLGTEVGGWYLSKRTMQGAADAAAFSAATAKAQGAPSAAYGSEASSIAAGFGYVDATDGVTVTLNSPPLSGNYTSDNSAVEVIVSQPRPLLLSGLFLTSPPTVLARAVATLSVAGTGCVLALDQGNVTDFSSNGNTVLNLNSCSMYVNSPNSDALNLVGQAQINAWSAFVSGGYQTSGGAELNTTHGTFTHAAPANDPYANVATPQPSGNQGSIGKSGSYTPGTYSGISLTSGQTANLAPGVYVIDSGSIDLHGGATLTGDGVTIVLTSSGNTYGTVTIRGGSTVNLTAPTSGDTAGIAIMQDRNAPQSASDSFAGGTGQNITGAIYFPNQPVTFSGGTSTGGAACTQLIALTITFNGNANFNNNCAGTGTRGLGTSFVQLVE